MSENIEVKYQGLTVRISTMEAVKNGVVYISYHVRDYTAVATAAKAIRE
jgi:hypothetical protein